MTHDNEFRIGWGCIIAAIVLAASVGGGLAMLVAMADGWRLVFGG